MQVLLRQQVDRNRVCRSLVDGELDSGRDIKPDRNENLQPRGAVAFALGHVDVHGVCPVSKVPLIVVRQIIFAPPGLKQTFCQSPT